MVILQLGKMAAKQETTVQVGISTFVSLKICIFNHVFQSYIHFTAVFLAT